MWRLGGASEPSRSLLGAFPQVMEREECRLGGRVALHEMEEHTFAELDSPTDWQVAESYS